MGSTVAGSNWKRLRRGAEIGSNKLHGEKTDIGQKQWRQHTSGDSDVRMFTATHWRRLRRAEIVVGTHCRRLTVGQYCGRNILEETQTWGRNCGRNILEETQTWCRNCSGNTLEGTQTWGRNSGGKKLE